jgi:hypothetical protein
VKWTEVSRAQWSAFAISYVLSTFVQIEISLRNICATQPPPPRPRRSFPFRLMEEDQQLKLKTSGQDETAEEHSSYIPQKRKNKGSSFILCLFPFRLPLFIVLLQYTSLKCCRFGIDLSPTLHLYLDFSLHPHLSEPPRYSGNTGSKTSFQENRETEQKLSYCSRYMPCIMCPWMFPAFPH